MSIAIREWGHAILSPLGALWRVIMDLGAVLKYCRFSVLMLFVGFGVLVLAPQGQDVLRAMAEYKGSLEGKTFWQWVFFLIVMCWWGVNVWYWASVMLRFKFDNDSRLQSSNQKRIQYFNRHTPRILGTLAFLIVALGFARAAYDIRGLPLGSEYHTFRNLVVFSILCVAMAILFHLFVIYRVALIRWISGWLAARRPSTRLGNYMDRTHTNFTDRSYVAKIAKFSELGIGTKLSLFISIIIAFFFFLLFTFKTQSAGLLGTGSIILLAAGTWIPIGSIVVWWGGQYRVPVLTLLAVYLIVCSFFNDNHQLRTFPDQKPPDAESVSENFSRWLQARADTRGNTESHPVIMAAAEGGGIRAAYWTAIVLTALQDRNPDFGNDLYAFSGVSGGSLGGAVFNALLKENLSPTGVNCAASQIYTTGTDSASMQACAEAVLGHDFLSPTIAAMLYPDMTQRFLPFPIPKLDRARALENAWDAGWSRQFNSRPFAESFHEIWQPPGTHLPALFLNGTSVETGKRIITSNIKIDQTFSDADDFFSIIEQAVPLSTAVHNSARFTFVSPAGLIKKDGDQWGRIVDGGYFENSGTTTTAGIFENIKEVLQEKQIQPVFIMITNDPNQCTTWQPCEQPEPSNMLSEVLAPLQSILNTRSSRGSFAREKMKHLIESQGGIFWEFGLQNAKLKGPLPLGWELSEAAQDVMREDLREQLDRLPDHIRMVLGHKLSRAVTAD